MELLFLEPVFKEAIWGGTKLRDSFGYEVTQQESAGRSVLIKMVTVRLQVADTMEDI